MRRWVCTFGGCGMSPHAPGTAASFVTCLAIYAVHTVLRPYPAVATFPVWSGFLIAGLLISGALSVAMGPWAAEFYQRKDPPPFVLDEVAGVCLTMLFLPMAWTWREIWIVLLAFVAFRAFDVTKPWPAKRLESLPHGWGILMDDLAAAAYANIACQLLLRLVLMPLFAPV